MTQFPAVTFKTTSLALTFCSSLAERCRRSLVVWLLHGPGRCSAVLWWSVLWRCPVFVGISFSFASEPFVGGSLVCVCLLPFSVSARLSHAHRAHDFCHLHFHQTLVNSRAWQLCQYHQTQLPLCAVVLICNHVGVPMPSWTRTRRAIQTAPSTRYCCFFCCSGSRSWLVETFLSQSSRHARSNVFYSPH